jgi:hypothetical protein
MKRRQFLGGAAGLGGLAAATTAGAAGAGRGSSATAPRDYLAGVLDRMASPILGAMAQGRLRAEFKVELSPIWDGRDPAVSYMEGFSRLMSGLAPWLALPDDETGEGRRRRTLRDQAQASFTHAVDPASPDYLLWRKEGQPLVDSAYFTNALLRAPKALWEPLPAQTKARIVEEIKGLRRVSPPYTNWLLFAAMNEAFLLSIGEAYDPLRISLAIRKINEWYVGDGWIADGERFHFDYYNSFVMHPMMLEILEVLVATGAVFDAMRNKALYEQQLIRIQRYGEQLERMVSPEGTFPPIGRSLTYRTAAFQPLALLAWRKQLPKSLPEGQVRSALDAVHRRIFDHPGNFGPQGFLTLGFAGHQPGLADVYSNSGSMYIASESFLALGLPARDSYWTGPAQDWTARRAYGGQPFPRDHAIEN